MGIPDPIKNCVLEICCGPARAESRLAEAMVDAGVCDKAYAGACAKWVMGEFDLAPKGSLVQLKNDIAALARGASGA